ncbi:protein FAM246C-like [Eubalaena glacialis]|uniref:protein FAM246C-like n=1 Tax=Eubalaena glacialis TaxID=27606 RepID=UPI002A59D7EC|nr:protein FAM246C-like [Eubalaena glacialis]
MERVLGPRPTLRTRSDRRTHAGAAGVRGADRSKEAGAEARRAVPARQAGRGGAGRGGGAREAPPRPPHLGRGRAPAGCKARPPGRRGLSAGGCPGRNRLPRVLRGSFRSEREPRKVAVTVGEESTRQVSNKSDSGRRIPQHNVTPGRGSALAPRGTGPPPLRSWGAAPENRGCRVPASGRLLS